MEGGVCNTKFSVGIGAYKSVGDPGKQGRYEERFRLSTRNDA